MNVKIRIYLYHLSWDRQKYFLASNGFRSSIGKYFFFLFKKKPRKLMNKMSSFTGGGDKECVTNIFKMLIFSRNTFGNYTCILNSCHTHHVIFYT